MHTVGLHSALAIKRQRKRREEVKKARERRYSSNSSGSGLPGSSTVSIAGSTEQLKSRPSGKKANILDTKVVSTIGMLHVGIVFVVLGMFLVGSGLIPDENTGWQNVKFLNELGCSGLACIVIGIFLVVLNHYLSEKEDDELSRYVERQLTRSRSGKRLIKDEETGHMATKQELRCKSMLKAVESASASPPMHKSPPPFIQVKVVSDLEKIVEDPMEKSDEDAAAVAAAAASSSASSAEARHFTYEEANKYRYPFNV